MAYRKKAYTQREEVMENNAKYFINFKDGQRAFHELEILQRRALRLHKSLDELLLDAERDELLYRTIDALPETQRRRFLLHYEYDYKLYEIGRMEHCAASSVGKSVSLAREKIKAQMKEYLYA